MPANRKKLLIYAVLIGAFLAGRKAIYLRSERNVLDHSEDFILYSLSGAGTLGTSGAPTFHNYRILGQTKVTDSVERTRLVSALYAGMPTGADSESACFSPRHGIRATWNGHTVDAEICFECGRVYFYTNGKPSSNWPVNAEPRPVFNQALTAAHLPLAK